MRHFLKETDFDRDELAEVMALAQILKQNRGVDDAPALAGKSWGMLFYKNSTRTRVSFEVGIRELGGNALVLDKNSLQLSRGESAADTARVMSRYLHGLVIRCFDHATIEAFADAATIPVVNALTDFLHPCQTYADIFTLAECWSGDYSPLHSLEGKKLAFFGDTACNMANSWILTAALTGMRLTLAGPPNYAPGPEIDALLQAEGLEKNYTFTSDPVEAAIGADAVYTDVWVSMGDEDEAAQRVAEMMPYAVTPEIMAQAKPDARFLHCLPAHPGQEVAQEVLDSPNSVIFDQAENRLHVQKAILALLVEK